MFNAQTYSTPTPHTNSLTPTHTVWGSQYIRMIQYFSSHFDKVLLTIFFMLLDIEKYMTFRNQSLTSERWRKAKYKNIKTSQRQWLIGERPEGEGLGLKKNTCHNFATKTSNSDQVFFFWLTYHLGSVFVSWEIPRDITEDDTDDTKNYIIKASEYLIWIYVWKAVKP